MPVPMAEVSTMKRSVSPVSVAAHVSHGWSVAILRSASISDVTKGQPRSPASISALLFDLQNTITRPQG